MKLSFKLDPNNVIEYDTISLNVNIKSKDQKNFIEVNPYPLKVNYSKYINLKTKFRPTMQKIDTLVLIYPRCNGKCWYCSNKNSVNNNIDESTLKEFKKSLNKFKDKPYKLAITGGEPTENFDFFEVTVNTLPKSRDIQLFTTLSGVLNNFSRLSKLIKLLKKFENVYFFITIDGLHSLYHPTYNNRLVKLLDTLLILRKNLNCKIIFKHNLSSPNFIKVYNYLLENVEFPFGYSILPTLESYNNSFNESQIKELSFYAKKTYQFVKENGLPIRSDITYYNTNMSNNILPLLKGKVLSVNNSYHLIVTKNGILIKDPLKDYPCYNCSDFPNCNTSKKCKKIYKRCFKCPILYTCCFSSGLLPYYKTTTCPIAIRAEILNYFLILKSKRNEFIF